jgi:hypothetical protein
MVSLERSSSGIEILCANTPYLARHLLVGECRKQGFMGTPFRDSTRGVTRSRIPTV